MLNNLSLGLGRSETNLLNKKSIAALAKRWFTEELLVQLFLFVFDQSCWFEI